MHLHRNEYTFGPCTAAGRRLGAILLLAAVAFSGCKKKTQTESSAGSQEMVSIQNIGSDTMVQVAQAWAEAYAEVEPNVSIEVSGGGSGVGAAALINGTADIANASRKLKAEEIEKAKETSGHEPKEFVVGFDGMAVYVHKDNPIEEISVEELAGIYGESGKITTWANLGVKGIPGAKSDEIIRVSRQNNSGTYAYFREAILGEDQDFKHGSMDMNGSKDVVELVGKTPGAIGYSGLGYATPAVKIVQVSPKKGEPGVMPTIATVLDKSYPIARPLLMYTPGQPSEAARKYLDWIMSPTGQKIVEDTGYVPLPKQ